MTQKRKTQKITRIPKKDYDQLNFFYKLYYFFMCFFNEAYCPDDPPKGKYWTNGLAAEQTRGIAAEQTSGIAEQTRGIAAEQTRVNDGVTNPELDNLLGTLHMGNIISNGNNSGDTFYSNGNNSGDTFYSNGNNNSGDTFYNVIGATRRQATKRQMKRESSKDLEPRQNVQPGPHILEHDSDWILREGKNGAIGNRTVRRNRTVRGNRTVRVNRRGKRDKVKDL